MKLGFFLREALRALRRNAAPSFAAFATVLITTFTLGVFIPVVRAVTGKANEVKEQIKVEVFLEDDAREQEIQELGNRLRDLEHVESVEFISKQEALERCPEISGNPEICETQELLDKNPLPASYLVELDDPENFARVKDAIEPVGANGKPQPISPAIAKERGVEVRERDAKKILSATRTIKIVLGILVGLLLLASILLVSNTIRLSIYARRREVEVMRLVGATNWFVRWPFVIEGLIVGLFAGICASLLLWLAKVTLVDPLEDSYALVAAPDTVSFPALVAVLLAAAMIVSAIGSGITLRRFLRI